MNNSFPPILPKYGDAFLSAVSPRVPGRYPTSTSHPHPTTPSLHPFYMAVAPPMHLNPHPNSGINPYKLPASLSHLLEHLTASSPRHQPRISIAEDDKKIEEEKENETNGDVQNEEKRDNGGKEIYVTQGFSICQNQKFLWATLILLLKIRPFPSVQYYLVGYRRKMELSIT
jgi:hypothetical protein